MAIYLRVSTKTKEARRKLEEIGNRSGKCLLKTFLDFELKNKLSNKFEPRAIIDYVTTTNDNIIYTFAEFLKNNEGDREKFKEAVKFQATSAGTNKKGLFYNLIYQNGSLNMGTLNKSKIKAFLLAKSDKDSIIDDQDVTDKEDKKSHRMKNTDIVKKLKSGRLSNILKVFMALVLWKYLKLKETEQNQPNPKPEPQPEPEPVNTRKTESVSDKKTEQTEDSSDEETEDVSAKEIEQLETKVKEIPLQNFQVKSSGVDDCQKSHTTPIPYGQGDAKLKTPYHTSLMREHLNEALVWNNQGVTFNDEFFECQDIPEWRTQQHRDVYRGSIYGMFGKSEFLGGLQFKKEEGTIKRFEEYVFEASVKNGENLPRIDLIKNLDINLYYLFYNELSWIYEHQDFLKKEDKDDPGVLYEYRLKRHVDDLNDECSTELRSLIEAWALEVDKLEDIEKGKTAQKFDASTTSKKILTQLRFGCLEELAQKVASNAAPDDTTKIRPEIQEVVRYQCAQALNVPS
ncbi:MAG: hypothetical protein Q4D57_06675, partial [Clostridia bacterium]|nr:hypothetical protein [Clostridia bacterium]